jgi:FkbM family methyltransferase
MSFHKGLEALRYRVMSPRLYYAFRAWRHYIRANHYAEPELRLLRALVDPARDAIDVGANKGVYTYFLSRLAKQVYAYEANPRFIPILESVVAGNVQIIHAAASDTTGNGNLVIPINNKGESNNAASLEPGKYGGDIKSVAVSTRRLDEEGYADIGFIKIDVEGHEESVIRGSRGLLESQRPVLLVEIEESHRNADIRQTFALVEESGYQGFMVENGRMVPIERFDAERHQRGPRSGGGGQYVKNFIFRPRENRSGT